MEFKQIRLIYNFRGDPLRWAPLPLDSVLIKDEDEEEAGLTWMMPFRQNKSYLYKKEEFNTEFDTLARDLKKYGSEDRLRTHLLSLGFTEMKLA